MNLPQDLTTFATSLPRLPSELDVPLVRKEGVGNSHRDFRVRRSVVLRALQWLKQHNKYYHNIEISQAALSQLPTDGELTGLCTVNDTTVDEEEEHRRTDDQIPHDVTTFIPAAARKLTEQEAVRKAVLECQSSAHAQVVPWPTRGDTPINEFTTEGLRQTLHVHTYNIVVLSYAVY